MKEYKKSITNLILAGGILLLLAGFLTIIVHFNGINSQSMKFWPMFFLLIGFSFLYVSIAFTRKPYQIFLGVLFCFSACFSVLFVQNVIPFGLAQWWPIYGSLAGISLVFTGIYKHHKLKPRFAIPGFILIVLSFFFLFFSLDVIKVPLSKVFAVAGPVLLIGGGLTLIILFFVQTNHKELVIKDEENEVFED